MNPKKVPMATQKDRVAFSVYVSEKDGGVGLVNRLETIAKKEDRSLNKIVCRALAEYANKGGKPKTAKKAASSPGGKG